MNKKKLLFVLSKSLNLVAFGQDETIQYKEFQVSKDHCQKVGLAYIPFAIQFPEESQIDISDENYVQASYDNTSLSISLLERTSFELSHDEPSAEIYSDEEIEEAKAYISENADSIMDSGWAALSIDFQKELVSGFFNAIKEQVEASIPNLTLLDLRNQYEINYVNNETISIMSAVKYKSADSVKDEFYYSFYVISVPVPDDESKYLLYCYQDNSLENTPIEEIVKNSVLLNCAKKVQFNYETSKISNE